HRNLHSLPTRRSSDLIESTSNNDFWLADAHNYLASIYIERGDIETAKACFEKSECYYKTALGEYYDEIYLDFIVNASHFYAQNGDRKSTRLNSSHVKI